MKYLIDHKDLSRWCKEKSLELDQDEPVHDLAGAEALIERSLFFGLLSLRSLVYFFLFVLGSLSILSICLFSLFVSSLFFSLLSICLFSLFVSSLYLSLLSICLFTYLCFS